MTGKCQCTCLWLSWECLLSASPSSIQIFLHNDNDGNSSSQSWQRKIHQRGEHKKTTKLTPDTQSLLVWKLRTVTISRGSLYNKIVEYTAIVNQYWAPQQTAIETQQCFEMSSWSAVYEVKAGIVSKYLVEDLEKNAITDSQKHHVLKRTPIDSNSLH